MTSVSADTPLQVPPAPAPCMIVSSDGHVGPSVKHTLRPYCEQRYLERYDDYVDQLEVNRQAVVPMELPDYWLEALDERGRTPGLEDPHARLRDMDRDGVCADVIYQGGGNGESIPFFNFSLNTFGFGQPSSPLEAVGVHIYNRWLADFVSVAPERHAGIAHITVQDIGQAVREVEWAKGAGLNGVNLPAPRRGAFPPYTDGVWDPLWSACQDLQMPVSSHGGGGEIDFSFTGPAANAIYLVEYPWFGRRAVWHMIFGGVFHRFPGLNYVVAEQFGDWVPATLKDMDSAYLSSHSGPLREVLPDLPSDYFMRNCFVGASFMSHEEAQLGCDAGLTGTLMWGGDYPHAEGCWPQSVLSLRKAMAGVPEDTVRAYIGGTSAHVYHLDTLKLGALAERIGPSWNEMREPYVGRPDDLPTSFGFRQFGHWT